MKKKKTNGVKKIRTMLGMSRDEFAKAIGKKWPSTVSNYENGQRELDSDTAWAIVDLAKSHGHQVSLEDIYVRQ